MINATTNTNVNFTGRYSSLQWRIAGLNESKRLIQELKGTKTISGTRKTNLDFIAEEFISKLRSLKEQRKATLMKRG